MQTINTNITSRPSCFHHFHRLSGFSIWSATRIIGCCDNVASAALHKVPMPGFLSHWGGSVHNAFGNIHAVGNCVQKTLRMYLQMVLLGFRTFSLQAHLLLCVAMALCRSLKNVVMETQAVVMTAIHYASWKIIVMEAGCWGRV